MTKLSRDRLASKMEKPKLSRDELKLQYYMKRFAEMDEVRKIFWIFYVCLEREKIKGKEEKKGQKKVGKG